ncbi:hypothetical protein ACFQ6E_34790 [Streptomyces sp. NPDC056462]|uniref:hypothetical protein n=1 Tax=Streptomyces sp. NPDC056462 TaxID=3345826 RepID=UPI00369438DB
MVSTKAPEDAYIADPFLPDRPLHRDATRTVFGVGDRNARVMLVLHGVGDVRVRRIQAGFLQRSVDRAAGRERGQGAAGVGVRVGEVRGTLLKREIHGRPEKLVATVHPSSVLRARDDADREAAYAGLVSDLKVAARALS